VPAVPFVGVRSDRFVVVHSHGLDHSAVLSNPLDDDCRRLCSRFTRLRLSGCLNRSLTCEELSDCVSVCSNESTSPDRASTNATYAIPLLSSGTTRTCQYSRSSMTVRIGSAGEKRSQSVCGADCLTRSAARCGPNSESAGTYRSKAPLWPSIVHSSLSPVRRRTVRRRRRTADPTQRG